MPIPQEDGPIGVAVKKAHIQVAVWDTIRWVVLLGVEYPPSACYSPSSCRAALPSLLPSFRRAPLEAIPKQYAETSYNKKKRPIAGFRGR